MISGLGGTDDSDACDATGVGADNNSGEMGVSRGIACLRYGGVNKRILNGDILNLVVCYGYYYH